MTTVASSAETAAAPEESARALSGRSTAWWGVVVLILTEGMIFATLLSSYLFIRAASKEWPPPPIEVPELTKIWFFTAILLGSSLPMAIAEHGIAKGNVRRLKVGLTMVLVMGVTFFCYLIYEYRQLKFGIRDNAYGTLFYSITGLHGAHVVGGLLMISLLLVKTWMGKFSAERHVTVQVVAMYWHFVDGVWVFVFSTLYLSPHFLR
jgi:heme/copper-type cytochrome/quinol oxidase subunit 3